MSELSFIILVRIQEYCEDCFFFNNINAWVILVFLEFDP